MEPRTFFLFSRKLEAARELYGLSPTDEVAEDELKAKATTGKAGTVASENTLWWLFDVNGTKHGGFLAKLEMIYVSWICLHVYRWKLETYCNEFNQVEHAALFVCFKSQFQFQHSSFLRENVPWSNMIYEFKTETISVIHNNSDQIMCNTLNNIEPYLIRCFFNVFHHLQCSKYHFIIFYLINYIYSSFWKKTF